MTNKKSNNNDETKQANNNEQTENKNNDRHTKQNNYKESSDKGQKQSNSQGISKKQQQKQVEVSPFSFETTATVRSAEEKVCAGDAEEEIGRPGSEDCGQGV